jgi:hypothetical protein
VNDSRVTLELRAFVLVGAFLAVSIGLLAGHDAAEFIEGRAANLAQVLLSEGR